jgi:hypothetical protein
VAGALGGAPLRRRRSDHRVGQRLNEPPCSRPVRARKEAAQLPGQSASTYIRGIEGHHLVHWGRGGTTDVDNLVLL